MLNLCFNITNYICNFVTVLCAVYNGHDGHKKLIFRVFHSEDQKTEEYLDDMKTKINFN